MGPPALTRVRDGPRGPTVARSCVKQFHAEARDRNPAPFAFPTGPFARKYRQGYATPRLVLLVRQRLVSFERESRPFDFRGFPHSVTLSVAGAGDKSTLPARADLEPWGRSA